MRRVKTLAVDTEPSRVRAVKNGKVNLILIKSFVTYILFGYKVLKPILLGGMRTLKLSGA